VGKTLLVVIAFGVISVLLTALAAWLAMHRPGVEHLTVETRSRLAADYSVDLVARRIEPLDPDIVRAAASDEASLTREQPATTPPRRVAPSDVTPVATALPTSTPRPSPTVRGAATGTPPPGSTAKPGDPTATLRPGETPRPSSTPSPGTTPGATATLPVPTLVPPTVVLPTATLPPVPTFVPTSTPVPPTTTPVPTLLPTSTPVPPTSTPAPTSTPTATPTATPTSIIGQILNSLSCSVLGTIGSLPGGNQTSITFVNESGETIRVYELRQVLDLSPPILRATIPDGDDYTRNTQVGIAFKVTDLSDNCIAVYRAVPGGGTAIID
jgi:hypothetical protein